MTRTALISLGIATTIALLLLFVLVTAWASGIVLEREYGNAEEPLPYSDKPLMTEEEKEMARETGVARYMVGRAVYLDDELPPEFYEED